MSKVMWDLVIERIVLRLDSWKAALLTKGGRLTLINLTLASIPSYFLWNDSDDHHCNHLMDWNTICRPMSYSGLGCRLLRSHTRVLLANWLLRFGVENVSLWWMVVVARFGKSSIRESMEVFVRNGCGLWKSIRMVNDDFWKFIRF